jgi:tetratricopeptide (TPR) repeat protein
VNRRRKPAENQRTEFFMMTRFTLRTIGALTVAAGILLAQNAAPQPKPKSQEEGKAVMAIFNTQDPDARVAAVENLLTKFSDTEFKAIALQVAAASEQQKNDYEKMVVYAERTLQVDPKNYPCMLMLAAGLAQHTREFDLDKEEKLSKAEKYAKDAMALVPTAPKPRADVPDAQWEAAKKDYLSQGHEALGMIALVRKKYDVAQSELKTAVESASTPDPTTMVRLAGAYNQGGKPDEALAVVDKVLAMPDLHPTIKQVAGNEKMNAMKLKSGQAKPPSAAAAPSGPAQVPIKQ